MITIKCEYTNSDTITTGFNGTYEDAEDYFLGNVFNIGNGEEDNLQKCIKAEQIKLKDIERSY